MTEMIPCPQCENDPGLTLFCGICNATGKVSAPERAARPPAASAPQVDPKKGVFANKGFRIGAISLSSVLLLAGVIAGVASFISSQISEVSVVDSDGPSDNSQSQKQAAPSPETSGQSGSDEQISAGQNAAWVVAQLMAKGICTDETSREDFLTNNATLSDVWDIGDVRECSGTSADAKLVIVKIYSDYSLVQLHSDKNDMELYGDVNIVSEPWLIRTSFQYLKYKSPSEDPFVASIQSALGGELDF